VTSSSVGWSGGCSASESGPAIRVDSAKNFPMGPLGSDEADEVTSAFGMTTTSWSLFYLQHLLFDLGFVAGVRPQDA